MQNHANRQNKTSHKELKRQWMKIQEAFEDITKWTTYFPIPEKSSKEESTQKKKKPRNMQKHTGRRRHAPRVCTTVHKMHSLWTNMRRTWRHARQWQKQHFAILGCGFGGKSPVFQPKPTGNSAYKYNSSHSQLLIQNVAVQEEGKHYEH